MNLVQDVLTYIRRIIKSPSDAEISDNLLLDYLNRFMLLDMSARMQLFDFKTVYQFLTVPGISTYNMPLYQPQIQPGAQIIAPYPVYQGFEAPCKLNGIDLPLYTSRELFYNLWPSYLQQGIQVATGDGGAAYSFYLPFYPAIPGYLDITGIQAIYSYNNTLTDPPFVTSLIYDTAASQAVVPTTSVYPGVYINSTADNGSNIVVTDSGQFFDGANSGDLYGLLIEKGNYPLGDSPLSGNSYSLTKNTVNYTTGLVNVTFNQNIPSGTAINCQSLYIEQGLPRALLFENNAITLRNPPDKSYQLELTAYLTPLAFLNSPNALPFAYMSEYIARGTARKIMADTGDIEQFQMNESLFKEQELLVWKRSQRINTATRKQTIYSNTGFQSNFNQSSLGT